MNDTKAMFGY